MYVSLSFSLLWGWIRRTTDIPTNAESAGDYDICVPAQVSVHFWVHFTAVSWEGVVELFVACLVSLRNTYLEQITWDWCPTDDRSSPSVSFCFSSTFIEVFRLTFYVSVGKPIHVRRCEKPTLEELTRVQQRYIEELTRFVSIFPPSLLGWNWREWGRIWNTYKDTFVWGSWTL